MKKLQKLILSGLTIILLVLVNFSFSTSISYADQGNQRAGDVQDFTDKLQADTYDQSQCDNTGRDVNEEEYNFMYDMIMGQDTRYTNFVTFLDQPLSSKNNVLIAEECVPGNSSGDRAYTCTQKVTCKCEPRFPDISSTDPDEQKSITCRRVQFIVYKTGQELAGKYVNMIYRWVASIVGIVAVIYIIVNGIIISAAQNDSGQVTAAKDRIVQSLIAMVVLLCASLILYAINPNFFTRDIVPQQQQTSTSQQPAQSQP
jgi:hypothetical protein